MSKFIILFLVLLNWGEESFATTLRGARARSGQFPWLIQFQTIAPCGGILVSPDWVLTAAQCVQYKRNSIILYAAGLNGTGSRQTMGVKATYIFPQYQAYSTMHDHEHNIALLKLVQPFDMCDDKVQLLDMAPVRLDDDYKTCLIFGWQSYVAPSTKVLAKPVQYSHVLLNAWNLCTYMLKGNTSYNNVFCTMIESEDGMRACAGNPGSPVVCQDQYQRMILLGIASWTNFSLDCAGIPTYLRVDIFRSWMNNLIFNDRKIDVWQGDVKSISKSTCGRNRYRGTIMSATNIWNHSDLLKSEYQERANQRVNVNNKPLSRVWNPSESDHKEESLPDFAENDKNSHHINDYSGILSKYGIPFDVVRERDDNLKQYHEVGQGKEASGRISDITVAFPAEEGTSSYLGQLNIGQHSNKDVKNTAKIDLDDELDDLDFVIPLDEEYFIGRSHSLHFCLRDQSFFSIFFFTFFISCTLMIFL